MAWSLRLLLFVCFTLTAADEVLDEESGKRLLQSYDLSISDLCHESTVANWEYNTNLTEENQQKMIAVELRMAKFVKQAWQNFTKYVWENFTDPSTKRQFKLVSVLGTAALPDEKYAHLKGNISDMEEIYATTKVCQFNDSSVCNLNLDPEITELMLVSRNYNELLDVWNQWHTKVGRPIKPIFETYVRLSNEAAVLNGMDDLGDLWRYPYEDDEFEEQIASLWDQLEPLYLQLHAYMRRKLANIYGEGFVSRTGPIPAHLFGNMWAQDWSALYEDTKPFNVSESDVTAEMIKNNYTVKEMFLLSENFFTSLGMEPMTPDFWNNSMFERPNDREVVCHASAWDFCNGHDFRVKMCTTIRYEDLVTVHHEMGHIAYYQQYKDQPYIFRDGANPGFHEAIGDVIALSVATTKHLAKLNLSDEVGNETSVEDINFLYQVALKKLAFLPFGYVIDYYRWRLFKGDIPKSKWNEEWWKLRRDYQGIEPAVPRSPDDFDAAAKYHVAASVPYDRYFVATIVQFQFHKALCELAGEYNSTDPSQPLHHCDIYGSKAAGEKFSEAMKLGSSKPWPVVMEQLVGQKEMNASAFIDYFKPLYDYLKEDNLRNGAKVGWE